MGQGLWVAILEGELRKKALSSIVEIARDLPQFPFGRKMQDSLPESYRAVSRLDLGGGMAGAALLDSYLQKTGVPISQTNAMAEEFLRLGRELLDSPIEELSPSGGLYSGLSGIAWTLMQLKEDRNEEDEVALAKVDDLLLALLGTSPWSQEYDLISGFAGHGFYFLERLPNGRAQEGVEAVIDCLEETVQEKQPGLTWFTPPERLPEHQKKMAPQGYFNLGLAHGVPGVIAFLARACAAGIETGRARPLLDGAVRWLLAQKLPQNPRCRFDSWLAPGVEPRPSRTAWCYGDLGLAAAVLDAARCVGEASWENEALSLARAIAVRDYEHCAIADAGVCHGVAGNGHIFNRIFQATREPLFLDAARFWFEKTFSFHRPGEGVGGYFMWSGGVEGEPEWKHDNGFLSGSAGIGLALLTACSSVEPHWDRPLFVAMETRSS